MLMLMSSSSLIARFENIPLFYFCGLLVNGLFEFPDAPPDPIPALPDPAAAFPDPPAPSINRGRCNLVLGDRSRLFKFGILDRSSVVHSSKRDDDYLRLFVEPNGIAIFPKFYTKLLNY